MFIVQQSCSKGFSGDLNKPISTFQLLQKTAFSLVKSRVVDQLVVCSVAENGLILRKMVVECPQVITSIGETHLQARPVQERGIIGPFCLLHS